MARFLAVRGGSERALVVKIESTFFLATDRHNTRVLHLQRRRRREMSDVQQAERKAFFTVFLLTFLFTKLTFF